MFLVLLQFLIFSFSFSSVFTFQFSIPTSCSKSVRFNSHFFRFIAQIRFCAQLLTFQLIIPQLCQNHSVSMSFLRFNTHFFISRICRTVKLFKLIKLKLGISEEIPPLFTTGLYNESCYLKQQFSFVKCNIF